MNILMIVFFSLLMVFNIIFHINFFEKFNHSSKVKLFIYYFFNILLMIIPLYFLKNEMITISVFSYCALNNAIIILLSAHSTVIISSKKILR